MGEIGVWAIVFSGSKLGGGYTEYDNRVLIEAHTFDGAVKLAKEHLAKIWEPTFWITSCTFVGCIAAREGR